MGAQDTRASTVPCVDAWPVLSNPALGWRLRGVCAPGRQADCHCDGGNYRRSGRPGPVEQTAWSRPPARCIPDDLASKPSTPPIPRQGVVSTPSSAAGDDVECSTPAVPHRPATRDPVPCRLWHQPGQVIRARSVTVASVEHGRGTKPACKSPFPARSPELGSRAFGPLVAISAARIRASRRPPAILFTQPPSGHVAARLQRPAGQQIVLACLSRETHCGGSQGVSLQCPRGVLMSCM